jgi:hypothetical protein
MSIGINHRSNLPFDPLMMAKGGHEAANPPAVAFQNTASITPGYPQIPFATHFIPLPTRMPNPSDLWAKMWAV